MKRERTARHGSRPLISGTPAPSFALPDQTGRLVRTGKLLTRGPLVLVFARSLRCRESQLDLAALAKASAPIEAAGASVALIMRYASTEMAYHADRLGIGFPVLNDETHRVADIFGLRPFRRGDDTPMPARFVIATDGMIVFGDVYPGDLHRPDPLELLPVIAGCRSRRMPSAGQ